MPYPKVTAYDILEISPSATTDQIMKAYQEAVRKRKYSPQKCQQAFTDLRNPRKRIEIDLQMLCGVGDPEELSKFFASLPDHHFIPEMNTSISAFPSILSLVRSCFYQDFLDLPANPISIPDEKLDPQMDSLLPEIEVPV